MESLITYSVRLEHNEWFEHYIHFCVREWWFRVLATSLVQQEINKCNVLEFVCLWALDSANLNKKTFYFINSKRSQKASKPFILIVWVNSAINDSTPSLLKIFNQIRFLQPHSEYYRTDSSDPFSPSSHCNFCTILSTKRKRRQSKLQHQPKSATPYCVYRYFQHICPNQSSRYSVFLVSCLFWTVHNKRTALKICKTKTENLKTQKWPKKLRFLRNRCHEGGGFKMNFLIFFRSSLETAQKVHTLCELSHTLFDLMSLSIAYFSKIYSRYLCIANFLCIV